MRLTEYHAKYMALALSKSSSSDSFERLVGTLSDAQVDLNPHQVEAALFAFKSPFSRGVIYADEVGLGKSVETGIVLSQKWAENKRKILVIVPANLRKQWQIELEEKFYLPSVILDGDSFKQLSKDKGHEVNPFLQDSIVITSYNFAHAKSQYIAAINWDTCVIDEAHRLRNAYKSDNVIARSIRSSLGKCFKLLLTATPLQNSLLELYGLVSFIDDYTFGDLDSFKVQFLMIKDESKHAFDDLVARLKPMCIRTLRRQVLEYIKYTERLPITQEFEPTPAEQELYDNFSKYLQKEDLWALPSSGRHLISMILWKLLSSSTFAIAGTLRTLITRLEGMLQSGYNVSMLKVKHYDEALLSDYEDVHSPVSRRKKLTLADKVSLQAEINELKGYYHQAKSITHNAKGEALLIALTNGFKKLKSIKAPQKAVIFTESRRTQEYIGTVLSRTKYKYVMFNGDLNTVDKRQKVLDAFKDDANIMIATESAAEGLNLQFCTMVLNYDLPFNPQRIEQRIGRAHRYGQKFDVVVINFLNKNNIADRRVYELLCDKFQLFEGVFGASDSILGTIDALDFEKRVVEIYQKCRTATEIEDSFAELRASLEPQIDEQMKTIRTKLLENFDEDVARKLKINIDNSKVYLNRHETMLWELTKYFLRGHAHFGENSFFLEKNPFYKFYPKLMHYYFDKTATKSQRYRLNHPIAQQIIFDTRYNRKIYDGHIEFDLSSHKPKISALNHLKGSRGIMALYNLTITGIEFENHIICVAIDQDGRELPPETVGKLWNLSGKSSNNAGEIELLEEDYKAKRISHEEYETDLERYTNYLSDKENKQLHCLFEQHKAALIDEITHRNSNLFDAELDKLEKWAKDIKQTMERKIKDLDAQITELRAIARKTKNIKDKLDIQRQIKDFETSRNEQRYGLYSEQDKIDEQKEKLLEDTQKRLEQELREECVFRVKWNVV